MFTFWLNTTPVRFFIKFQFPTLVLYYMAAIFDMIYLNVEVFAKLYSLAKENLGRN